MLASPEVARAKCVPLYNLTTDPNATAKRAGVVSVIIVRRSAEAKPVPGLDLLNLVKDYLDARRLPSFDLVVVGPDYISVDVTTEIAVTSLDMADAVEGGRQPGFSPLLTSAYGWAGRERLEFWAQAV